MCPAHFIPFLTTLPIMQAFLVPTSSLKYFILLLSTLFTPPILLVKLVTHNRSLRWCCSERAIVSNISSPTCPSYLSVLYLHVITLPVSEQSVLHFAPVVSSAGCSVSDPSSQSMNSRQTTHTHAHRFQTGATAGAYASKNKNRTHARTTTLVEANPNEL